MVLAVLVVLGAACGSSKKINTNAARATATTPAAARLTPTPSAADLLSTATANTNALTSFHFSLTHENGTTPIAEGINMRAADGDFVKPDRFRANVNGTIAGGSTIVAKVINVGSQVWIALLDDRYQLLPNGIPASAILDPNNGVLKALRGVNSPTYAGADTINGVATTVIAGTIDAGDLTALDTQAQPGKQVKGRVWIGNADQRVYRIRIDGPLNDQEPATIARQIDLSQFDAPFSIQPPQ